MIEIHGREGCPFAWRVRIVARAKGVPFQWIRFDVDPPDAGHERNAGRKSPWLIDGDLAIAESMVIAQYLDEAYPGPALLPADPASRARLRVAAPGFDKLGANPNAPVTDEVRARVGEGLAAVAAALGDRPWLGGEQPSLFDAQVAPQLAVAFVRLGVTPPDTLAAYWARLQAWPAYAETRPPWA